MSYLSASPTHPVAPPMPFLIELPNAALSFFLFLRGGWRVSAIGVPCSDSPVFGAVVQVCSHASLRAGPTSAQTFQGPVVPGRGTLACTEHFCCF